jgi:hypothetical protein
VNAKERGARMATRETIRIALNIFLVISNQTEASESHNLQAPLRTFPWDISEAIFSLFRLYTQAEIS